MASIDYFLNGKVVSYGEAMSVLKSCAILKGYAMADIKAALRRTMLDDLEGEEAREYLEGVTSTQLELILVVD